MSSAPEKRDLVGLDPSWKPHVHVRNPMMPAHQDIGSRERMDAIIAQLKKGNPLWVPDHSNHDQFLKESIDKEIERLYAARAAENARIVARNKVINAKNARIRERCLEEHIAGLDHLEQSTKNSCIIVIDQLAQDFIARGCDLDDPETREAYEQRVYERRIALETRLWECEQLKRQAPLLANFMDAQHQKIISAPGADAALAAAQAALDVDQKQVVGFEAARDAAAEVARVERSRLKTERIAAIRAPVVAIATASEATVIQITTQTTEALPAVTDRMEAPAIDYIRNQITSTRTLAHDAVAVAEGGGTARNVKLLGDYALDKANAIHVFVTQLTARAGHALVTISGSMREIYTPEMLDRLSAILTNSVEAVRSWGAANRDHVVQEAVLAVYGPAQERLRVQAEILNGLILVAAGLEGVPTGQLGEALTGIIQDLEAAGVAGEVLGRVNTRIQENVLTGGEKVALTEAIQGELATRTNGVSSAEIEVSGTMDGNAPKMEDFGANNAAHGIKLRESLASEEQMTEIGHAIAGHGLEIRFRGAQATAERYGGVAEDYVKMSSSQYKSPDGRTFETHWIQNVRTGLRYEFKTKLIGLE